MKQLKTKIMSRWPRTGGCVGRCVMLSRDSCGLRGKSGEDFLFSSFWFCLIVRTYVQTTRTHTQAQRIRLHPPAHKHTHTNARTHKTQHNTHARKREGGVRHVRDRILTALVKCNWRKLASYASQEHRPLCNNCAIYNGPLIPLRQQT